MRDATTPKEKTSHRPVESATKSYVSHMTPLSLKNAFEAVSSPSSGLSSNQNDKGRPTIYSALGMAAKAYMQQGNYASAKPHLKSIIDSGKFSMQSDYAEIFKESNDFFLYF